ncbi:uncharacterized protein STEHIDRAFT_139121 [Stereum hirsutum FP-91666 SS1]|uniref:uncharacterized protein n=1 Tax=Stereum hirsutum (strain FP-91666) TaxID=721885 RepID=UPI000440FB96|nr:uncharacterized protein STEHIDRAFT_139121 [Stereum hirsutum FP-91666 SS1]EIM87447.1 hypothetical protein STEHIDRAFT_139121 [Stereum hirsutum FP-91666 SS1]
MVTPTKSTRSSLAFHKFPTFYSCYLLKSHWIPRSTVTYIGSTPNPPRRIRQHNGEITQGAWKTKNKRPWVMQMVVYGFPSKLAALQFEWAWQHPHVSRNLRDDAGSALFKRGTGMKRNILVARTMLSYHPYNVWPLHVKIFTEEAEKIWEDVSKAADVKFPLPRGFTYCIEYEGVDGKSGKTNTERIGPVDVSDDQFTTAHLTKWQTLLHNAGSGLECSVCHERLDISAKESLTTSLCPTNGCQAVSHLRCLSRFFLEREKQGTTIIPRGGSCPNCRSYVLWGDVVKGCFRRYAGKALQEDEDEDDEDTGELSSAGEENVMAAVDALDPLQAQDKVVEVATKQKTRRTDDNAMRPTSEEVIPRKGRPLKTVHPSEKAKKRPRATGMSTKTKRAYYTTANVADADDAEEFFDLNVISADSGSDDNAPPAPVRPQSKAVNRSVKSRSKPPLPQPSAGPSRTASTKFRHLYGGDSDQISAIHLRDPPLSKKSSSLPNLPFISKAGPLRSQRDDMMADELATVEEDDAFAMGFGGDLLQARDSQQRAPPRARGRNTASSSNISAAPREKVGKNRQMVKNRSHPHLFLGGVHATDGESTSNIDMLDSLFDLDTTPHQLPGSSDSSRRQPTFPVDQSGVASCSPAKRRRLDLLEGEEDFFDSTGDENVDMNNNVLRASEDQDRPVPPLRSRHLSRAPSDEIDGPHRHNGGGVAYLERSMSALSVSSPDPSPMLGSTQPASSRGATHTKGDDDVEIIVLSD